VISPATVDVLLQTLQTNAAPVIINLYDSHNSVMSAMSVKQLVLACLTRLVHIVYCLQPEQVNPNRKIIDNNFCIKVEAIKKFSNPRV